MLKEKIPTFFYNLAESVTRPQTVQRDENIYIIWALGGRIRFVSIPHKSGARAIFFEKDDLARCYNRIIKDIFKDYKNHLKKYKKSIKSLRQASVNLRKSATVKKSEKISAFKVWIKSQKDFYLPIIAPFAIEDILDQKCRELLKEELKEGAKEAFSIISSPRKINNYQKMRLEMINIFLVREVNHKDLKNLAKKYAWYGEYSYIEPLLDEEYFKKEFKKLNKIAAAKERNAITKEIQKNATEFKKLKNKIKSQKLKILTQVINDYTYLRTDRIEEFKKAQSRIRIFLKSIENNLKQKTKNKWTFLEVANLTNQEIFDFLQKEIIPNFKKAKKRASHRYIYYCDNSRKPKISYEPEFIKKAQKIIEKTNCQRQEITGVIAFSGVARGRVVIVNGKNDLGKIKKGTVLVARTTMPDYAPAMKIACAFVTEEGGVTSHAAIIARELKTPCLVGTKIATKVLKDGDLVEVDAEKGVVKILKKAK